MLHLFYLFFCLCGDPLPFPASALKLLTRPFYHFPETSEDVEEGKTGKGWEIGFVDHCHPATYKAMGAHQKVCDIVCAAAVLPHAANARKFL